MIRLKIKEKLLLMHIGIFVPIILFIYAVTIANLFTSTINNSADFLLRESYTSQVYIDQYMHRYQKDKPQELQEKFYKDGALFTSTLASKLNFRVQLYNNKGELISDSLRNSPTMRDADITDALKGDRAYVVKKSDDVTYLMFAIPFFYQGNLLGVIRYIYPMEREFIYLYQLVFTITLVVMAGIGIGIILSNIMANKINEPIKKLQEASKLTALGEYKMDIKVDSGDELEELADTFNETSKSIHEYIEQLKAEKRKQKIFFDNMTHEFKTPLTAIIGYANLIPRLKNKNSVDESLYYIENEGKRLLNLVEELLALGRLNRQESRIIMGEFDLEELIKFVLYSVRPRLQELHIEVNKNLKPMMVRGDKEKTQQVLLNIFDNILRHSKATKVQVAMEEVTNKALLVIKDNGVGIKPEICNLVNEGKELEYIPESQGNGFGMIISRAIMERQKGAMRICAKTGEGSCIELYFSTLGEENLEKGETDLA